MQSPLRIQPAIAALIIAGILLGLVFTVSLNALPDPRQDQTPPIDSVSGERSATLVARIYYRDSRDIAQLTAYDVLEYNNRDERYVLAMLRPVDVETLSQQGWRVEVDAARTARLTPDRRVKIFADGYRSVEELYAEMESTAERLPQLTQLVDYGQSHCLSQGGCVTLGQEHHAGYPLRAMRVTNEAVPGSSVIDDGVIERGTKPVFFLMANIHAREITTPELAMRLLKGLLDGYGVNADITWLLDWHELWIVPVVNPDGHWLVELGEKPPYSGAPFFQRKNANYDSDRDSTVDCPLWPPPTNGGGSHYGVDLNRNHSFGWGGTGSSGDACDAVFRGAGPGSEIEVVRLERLVRALIPDQRGLDLDDSAPQTTTGILISLHSFGDLVLWPWGNRIGPAPNKSGLKAIGDKMATYNGYQSCQSGALFCLYPTSGTSDDWAYGELGIPAFTFEIGAEFMPPYGQIDTVQWPLNRPALLYAARIARTPYETVLGPDVLGLAVSRDGTSLRADAIVNDSKSGNRPIVAAALYIDTPPWVGDAQMIPLSAADGSFDASVEAVNGSTDISSLAAGRHIIYVRGQDVDGHWGPVSAAFFDNSPQPVNALFLPTVIAE